MAKRPTFTPDQLQIGGNHLLYEVQMLCNAAALLESGGEKDDWGWQSRTRSMATLESFLMHARSLMYFLCPPKGYRQNPLKARELFAEDFCKADWKAKPWKGFGTERDAISIDLMHLSIDRLEVGRSWEYTRLLHQLKVMLIGFLEDADGLSTHVKGEIRAALNGKRVAVADTTTRLVIAPSLPGGSVPTTSIIAHGTTVAPASASALVPLPPLRQVAQ